MINLKGLNKAEVLATLYNNAKPMGLGHKHYDPADMTVSQADSFLKSLMSHLYECKFCNMNSDLDSIARNMIGTGCSVYTNYKRKGDLHIDYLKGRPIKLDVLFDEWDETQYEQRNGDRVAVNAINKLREHSNYKVEDNSQNISDSSVHTLIKTRRCCNKVYKS